MNFFLDKIWITHLIQPGSRNIVAVDSLESKSENSLDFLADFGGRLEN